MITLEKIAFAINETLAAAFPDIPIQSTDITEGFKRPSFFVDFEDVTASAYGSCSKERSITVMIYYFPKDRYKNKLEIMRVQEGLQNAFHRHLTIDEEFVIHLPEIEFSKVDGVLQSSFDLYTLESDLNESGEFAEHLNLTLEEGD